MATGPRFAVKFRRRRIGKTNYTKRLALLKSKLPRLVIRKSNRYITIQIVETTNKGDKVLASAHSKALKKLGWKYDCKNKYAAYLTGYMLGKSAKTKKAVADLGLYTLTKNCRIFAALTGAIEGGIDVPHGEDIKVEIKGKLEKDFEAIKSKIK